MAEPRGARLRVRSWVAVVLIAITGAGCHPMDDLLSSIFGRSMRDQPSLDPYDQPLMPAEGSVPFAAGNFPSNPETVQLGQAEVGEVPAPIQPIQLLQQAPEVMELENPIDVTDQSLARGEELFNRACTPCHGPTGEGDGLVTAAGMPSFSLLTDQARGYPDGYIYSIVRIGRGAMPSLGHQITHYDRWHVVNYVRQLQGPTPAASTAQDAEDR